jgi:hypothetical protein
MVCLPKLLQNQSANGVPCQINGLFLKLLDQKRTHPHQSNSWASRSEFKPFTVLPEECDMHLACLPLLATWFVATSTVAAGNDLTAETLHHALRQAVGKLDRCHLVLATRVNSTSPEGRSVGHDVQFFDVWMNADNVQLREVSAKPNDKELWWNGFQQQTEPLTKKKLSSVEWRIVCVRTTGDIVWADFVRLPERPKFPNAALSTMSRRARVAVAEGMIRSSQYATLYSTSRTVRRAPNLDFFVPLIELNRRWASGELAGGSPVVNDVSQVPFDKWRIVGKEHFAGTDVVKVEVPRGETFQFPLKRHVGALSFTSLWTCWFGVNDGFVARKIVNSVRYGIAGREYPYERAPGMPPLLVYEASDVRQPIPGVWFPMAGFQETYLPDYANTKPFDADVVVDSLVSRGKFVDHDVYRLSGRREWRVLNLATIPANLYLWIDPPDGTVIRSGETGALRIQGKSDEESRKILGVTRTRSLPQPARPHGPYDK